MQRLKDIASYFFGSIFNISLALGVVIVAYTITLWAFDYGQEIGEGMGQVMQDEYVMHYDEGIIIEIPTDASGLQIARLLRDEGLINNEFIFYVQTRLNGSHSHFIRGATFELSKSMDQGTIMHILQSQNARMDEVIGDEPRITIIEGLATWQIADIAAALGYFSPEDFLYEVENGEYTFGFLLDIPNRTNRLEGFLFPDTYILPQNPNPRDLVVRMLHRFDAIFTPEMRFRLEAELPNELGLTLSMEDIVTIASIVELEARVDSQRPMVAALIYNRLRNGMTLNMMSTLIYALNRPVSMITEEDFTVDLPHNTFVRLGLPASPISNPGLSSLQAALFPENIDYLYMTLRNYDTGELYFSQTYEEHQAAALRYYNQD